MLVVGKQGRLIAVERKKVYPEEQVVQSSEVGLCQRQDLEFVAL